MTRIESYARRVATLGADALVIDAADLMRAEGIGSVVVVGDDERPLGIVTDRDLAVRVIAEGRDPAELTVGAVMSQPLIEASISDPLEDAVAAMREHGVRRMPLVRDKRVVGLVAFDDLLGALSDELHDVARAARREITAAQRAGRVHQVRREIEDGIYEAIGHVQRIGDRALESAVSELEGMVRKLRKLV